MKIILGGGLIGLLAKEILGPDWFILPLGRSRYYSSWPPLADNHIGYHKDLNCVFDQFCLSNPRYWSRAVSYSGALIKEIPVWARSSVIEHIFGENAPPLAHELINGGQMVYDCQAKNVFDQLVDRYQEVIKENAKYGRPIKIEGNHLITEHGAFDFERMVSTIPLPSLYTLIGQKAPLLGGDVYVYEVETDTLNLEGASQVLVADSEIPFYKVNVFGKMLYQFFTHDQLGDANKVLGAFTKNRLVVRQASLLRGALPLGVSPDMKLFSKLNIECVGAEAQWDWFMDVAACTRRLLKLAGKLA